jgi:hypothetical protein
VTGATGETDSKAGANNFSLQLNVVDHINTPLCDNTNCYGVKQFIYDSPGDVYVQYWLINHGKTCPNQTIDPNRTWQYYDGSQGGAAGCHIDGYHTPVNPSQPVTNLAAQRLTGNLQSVELDVNQPPYSKYPANDGVDFLGIGTQWTTAEFNVFGWGNSSTANLTPNPGTTIVVRTSMDNGTTNAPNCSTGITNETNSLNPVPTFPCCQIGAIGGNLPAIVFTESNVASATSMCQCPAGEVWIPNDAACGPPAAVCKTTGVCASSWEWQYSITCTGMGVGIVYNGGCAAQTGEQQNCYAGFDGRSTVSASWGGVPGPPTWYTLGQQGSPTVCTSGFGEENCNVFTISGLPACPTIPTEPPPRCPNGEKYCLKFSPPTCVPASLCLVEPAHP